MLKDNYYTRAKNTIKYNKCKQVHQNVPQKNSFYLLHLLNLLNFWSLYNKIFGKPFLAILKIFEYGNKHTMNKINKCLKRTNN